MKGEYPTLSHTILLLIGLLATSLIVVSATISLSITEKNLVSTQLNSIADSVKNEILESYSLANQSSNYTAGTFKLDVPDEIGNKKYSIQLSQGMLLLNTSVRSEQIVAVRSLTIGAELNGKSFLPASIKIDKQNNIIKIGLV